MNTLSQSDVTMCPQTPSWALLEDGCCAAKRPPLQNVPHAQNVPQIARNRCKTSPITKRPSKWPKKSLQNVSPPPPPPLQNVPPNRKTNRCKTSPPLQNVAPNRKKNVAKRPPGRRFVTSQCHKASPLVTKHPPGGRFATDIFCDFGGRFATGDVLRLYSVTKRPRHKTSPGCTLCNDVLRFGVDVLQRFVAILGDVSQRGDVLQRFFCVIWGDALREGTFCNGGHFATQQTVNRPNNARAIYSYLIQ